MSLHQLVAAQLVSATLAVPAADAPNASTAAALDAIGESTSAIYQGDSTRALQALLRVPSSEFKGEDAVHRECMRQLWDRPSAPPLTGVIEDKLVAAVLLAYQRYWWQALKAPAHLDELEWQLLNTLRKLLDATPSDAVDMDAIGELLESTIKGRGHHPLTGRTPPLLEFMLWQSEQTQAYEVELPERRQSIKVVLMNGFVSFGWSSYALCGRGGTGGWSADDAVYAVASNYDLTSEKYRASLLAHEAQHFADKKMWPSMLPWELEYRAKLTELWAAQETQRDLVKKFTQQQSDNTNSPHTYANKRVLAALRRHLKLAVGADLLSARVDQIKQAASTALQEDTARRSR
jgi:hypothetical protein